MGNGSIVILIGNHKVSVSTEEAVTIRDSLCSRLGCPSFCCSEVAEDVVDGKIVNVNKLKLVSNMEV